MIINMLNNIKCENCNRIALELDKDSTIDLYNDINNISFENKDIIIDSVLSEYLVFYCAACGEKFKYTYRDIDFMLRNNLNELLITMLIRKDIIQKGKFSVNNNVYIYCGKCNGIDGRGACPSKVYNNCELKRLPYV